MREREQREGAERKREKGNEREHRELRVGAERG